MRCYESYVPTEYDWLPQVPSHWGRLPMRGITALSDVRNGNRSDLELLSVYREYGVIPKASRSDNHNVESANLSNYKYVGKGYLVMNKMKMWQGSLGISPCEGIVSPAYIVCRVVGDLNTQYLHRLLRTPQYKIHYNRFSKGIRVGQWDFSYDNFKTLYVYLPPREEQDKIVRFLDWKVSEVNHFIRQKRREIALLTELMNTRIKEVVFGGLNPSAATQDSGIQWVGYIPTHWKTKVLFEVAAEQSNSNKTVHNQNLLSLSYGKIVNKDINTMEGLLPASYDTYQVVDDSNIILRLTDLQNDKRSLRVGIATQTGIITSAYTCLKARGDYMLPHYLYLLLHSYDICKVFYSMGGGVRQSIGYGEIKRMSLPIPPTDEQQKIVDYCYALRADIDKMIAEVKREIIFITEYRTRMISDVVTGKVDVRDIVVPDFAVEEVVEDTGDEEETDEIADEEVEDNADD